MTNCSHCGKPMEDRGAEFQWCGDVCFRRWKIKAVPSETDK